MRSMKGTTLGILACALAVTSRAVAGQGPVAVRAQEGPPRRPAASPLLGILQAELQRNFEILKKEPVAPYFLSYAVHDTRATRIQTSFGALLDSGESRSRSLDIEVRVGDYDLDSTHQIRGDPFASMPRFSRVSIPISDEERAIRAILWRSTDRQFKQAVERLTKVRTNVAAKVQEENPSADFSREDPEVYVGNPGSYVLNTKGWEDRLRRLSAPFAENPLIFRADALLSVQADSRSFVSSEGSQILSSHTSCQLFVTAMTKASDGMELPLYASYFSATPEGLPREEPLLADVRRMMDLLEKLRAAPVVDPYSGPAILSGRAAGVFFHEIFGHRVEGHRQKSTDDAQTFAKKVGQLILPSFLNVAFDPTLQRVGNTELVGHYLYDDEGVKARKVAVVDHGVLKTFLLSRSPVANFPQSNGHGRGQPGFHPVSRQSNLLVESGQSVSYEKLVEMLKEECRKQGKPFGLLFQNIEGGFTFTGRTMPNAFNVLPNVVYRIYTDDRPPELVRGVDLIGTPLAAFGKIMATGDQADIFNGICGAESGGVPVSAASPALLVSEVEVQKKAKSEEALPLLPAPKKGKTSPTR